MQHINNIEKIIPDAYHGTTNAFADIIMGESKFGASTGDQQYLGDGAYFFESSLSSAKWWGRKTARKHSLTGFSAIKAVLNLGRCLDFNNGEHTKFIADVRNQLAVRGVNNINDAVVINFIGEQYGIDSVRACHGYNRSNYIFSGSRFKINVYIMICMRNLNLISGIELAYRRKDNE